MAENFNKIINDQSFEIVGPLSVVQRKHFLNEIIRDHDLMGMGFLNLTFLECNFINIDFRYAKFISCTFTNCTFSNIIFLKSEWKDCDFKNCKISQSDFVRSDFIESNLTDCQFNMVEMTGAFFTHCEWIQSTFNKVSFLESVTLTKSKICNSTNCIDVNGLDDVSKILDDLNLKD